MSECVLSKDSLQQVEEGEIVEDGEIVALPTLDALLDEKNEQIRLLKQKMDSKINGHKYRTMIENKLNAKQVEINDWVNRNSQSELEFEQAVAQHDRGLVFRMESQANTLVSEKEKTRQFLKEVGFKEKKIHVLKNNNTSEIQQLDKQLASKEVEITSLKIEKLRQEKEQAEELQHQEELRKRKEEKRLAKKLRKAARKADNKAEEDSVVISS